MQKVKLKVVVMFIEGKQFQLTDLLDGVGYKYNPDTLVTIPDTGK